jgi:hypothetical protein
MYVCACIDKHTSYDVLSVFILYFHMLTCFIGQKVDVGNFP